MAGGASNTDGSDGSNSSIAGSPITESPSGAGTNTFKSYGGGGGAKGGFPNTTRSGGSGGGAGYFNSTAGAGNTPSTSPSQGNNGGISGFGGQAGAGGGGGAGAVGGDGIQTSYAGGAGGIGSQSSITGVSPAPYYAGGVAITAPLVAQSGAQCVFSADFVVGADDMPSSCATSGVVGNVVDCATNDAAIV